MLVFIGPVPFLVGTEIVPHLLNPCLFALESGGKRLPDMCDYGEWGTDFAAKFHLLDHTLVGAMLSPRSTGWRCVGGAPMSRGSDEDAVLIKLVRWGGLAAVLGGVRNALRRGVNRPHQNYCVECLTRTCISALDRCTR